MHPITRFTGKPVVNFEEAQNQPSAADVIFRLRVHWNEKKDWLDIFSHFLQYPRIHESIGLVVGNWYKDQPTDMPARIVRALVASRGQLPNLQAIFFGDISFEESEISWIETTDLSPLLAGFPDLQFLRVRGVIGLSLGSLNHASLRHLGIESGGLPLTVLHDVLHSNLPKLEHLELWLGDDVYGFDFGLEDLLPLFHGDNFPALTYLGLRDSVITDEIAAAIANAPILDQLEELDLSMGTLGDEGAEALLASEKIRRLQRLNISHHYCSRAMMDRLKALPIEVDLSAWEYEAPRDDRYVAVSE